MRKRLLVSLTLFASTAAAAQQGDTAVVHAIEPIREKHHLPALGAAIVTSAGLSTSGVTGVRKQGTTVAATIDDQWHLGSDTKAMTATVIASLVERGKLSWESTIADVFPDLSRSFPPAFSAITLTELLSHHAGLVANADWMAISRSNAPLRDQRIAALKAAANTPLLSPPGTKFEYSNLGYVIAAAMAERVTDLPWESLIENIVFKPLGMSTCGFGGLGTPGKIDQPWPHMADGQPTGMNGPTVDNRPVMAPAGMVHCSIADWSKFIADQLAGERGHGALLAPATYKILHTPKFGGTYAFGWGVATRPWANGVVLTHNGSNTVNYCTVWIAPARDFAVLAVTNQGGDEAAKGTDEAVAAMIALHEQHERR